MTLLLLALIAGCGAPPPDPCEAAWAELDALRAGMADLGVDAVAPAHEVFLSACRQLPEDLRPCLSPQVAVADPDCAERMGALPEDVREALSLDAPEGSH